MSSHEPDSWPSAFPGFHPAFLYPFQLVVILLASFTPPESSIRYAAVFISGVLAWSFHQTCHDPRYFVSAVPKQFIGTFLTTYFFVAVERLLIRRWYFNAGGPTIYVDQKKNTKVYVRDVPEKADSSLWKQLVYASDLLFGPRSVGKRWEIKNVARYDYQNPSFVPSRSVFLLRTAAATAGLFMVADFARMAPPPDPGTFSPSKIPVVRRWSDVTAEQFVTRIFATIAYLLNTYCITSIVANVGGLLGVGTGLSSPASWRPTYGRFSDGYTIRKFWGTFWHQNIRAVFEGIAGAVSEDLLHLPQGSLILRYSKIYIAFLVSGFLHLGTDFGSGLSWRQSGSVQFFTTLALGIMIEDAIGAAWRSIVQSGADRKPTPLWQRCIGYCWTLLYLSWAMPIWIYPLIDRHRPGIDEVYPFSVAKYLVPQPENVAVGTIQ